MHSHNLTATPLGRSALPRWLHAEATPLDPSESGRWKGGSDMGQGGPKCPFGDLRGNTLTKCAGDGDLVSLTVALAGTSRSGHFICRYCMGDRTHRAAGEARPRVHQKLGSFLGQCLNGYRRAGHIFTITTSSSSSSLSFWGDRHNTTTNQRTPRAYR